MINKKKYHIDDRGDITESSSSRTAYRYRGGCSPPFAYQYYDDNI